MILIELPGLLSNYYYVSSNTVFIQLFHFMEHCNCCTLYN